MNVCTCCHIVDKKALVQLEKKVEVEMTPAGIFLTLMHALHDMTRCPRYDEEKDVPKVHRRQAAAARGTRCKSA